MVRIYLSKTKNLMKISKVTALSIWGIAIVWSMCGIVSYVSAASTTLNTDLAEAVEHISELYIVEDTNNIYTKISEGKSHNISIVGQTADKEYRDTNFIINNVTEDDSDKNKIESSTRSSILWWIKNAISRWTDNVIIAGHNNKISYTDNKNNTAAVIAWWVNNFIGGGSSSSVILWWYENYIWASATSNQYSTIAWWTKNLVNWNYSVAVGSGNQIYWNYSVAMWSGAIIENWDHTFFWSDGTKRDNNGDPIPLVNKSNVFVISSTNWLVVNSDMAAKWAQLTVWWPLIITANPESDSQIKCENGEWVWSIKLVEWEDGKSCLCSCNGTSWNSLYWQWVCEWVCNVTLHPECSDDAVNRVEKGGKYYYDAKCKVWNRVAWSMFMDKNKTIHWACQTSDSETIPCEWPRTAQ